MSTPVLVLTMSAHRNVAAGGRTRVVSELRFAVSGVCTPVVLALVPPRQWFPLADLLRARRLLQRDAGCRVLYWPALPALGRIRVRRLTNLIHALVTRVFAFALGARGIHAHGLGAATIAVGARTLGFRGWILYDAHGASPEEYEFAAGQRGGAWADELTGEEARVLAAADQVVVVSEALRQHFGEKYRVELTAAPVVPCATSDSIPSGIETRRRLKQKYGLQDRLVFAYAGSFRKYQMAGEMVTIFKLVQSAFPHAYFLVLTGDIARFSDALVAGGVSTNDYRILSMDHESVLRTLPLADVGFLLRADATVNRVASPTKFAEYCICGVPVLLTPFVGDYSGAVEQHDLGFCLRQFGLTDELLAFLKRVESDRQTFAESCYRYASRHLTWSSAGAVLQTMYANLNGSKSPE